MDKTHKVLHRNAYCDIVSLLGIIMRGNILKQQNKKRAYRFLVKALIVVIILGILVITGLLALQISGHHRLYGKFRGQVPSLSQDVWQDGDIRYQGSIYRYNKDILTFLFLGIDSDAEVEVKAEGIEGGQSDAIFLLVLNPHSKEVSVIAVNRNTMTDIDVYNRLGGYIGTVKGQITLQHGYGDGAQLSCERSREVVSRLFYDLPIHGYCSINMGAVPYLNDIVGGVEVTVLEDVGDLKEGQTTLLWYKEAYYYLRCRDVDSFGSADRRLERQKQYLTAYAAAAKKTMKEDITLPVKLYNTLSKYMVTDITIDEASYLAARILDYNVDPGRFYSLQGETVMGEEFEEFYVDEEALYELILEVFYEEVTVRN